MVCDVIDECRCYAFRGENAQFCGVRRGPNVLLCPPDCCHGGCTSDGSRQPFEYIDRTTTPRELGHFKVFTIISIIVLLYLLVTTIHLKNKTLR